MSPLQSAALVSAGWAAAGLTISAARAWRRATAAGVAPPAGPAWPGVLYAFGAGMSPLAKESARQHPILYVAGITYHLGVFAAMTTLIVTIAAIGAPTTFGIALVIALLAGAIAGVAFAVRRITTPLLRAISAPDDYAANLIVDAWLLTAAMSLLRPDSAAAFLLVSIVLGLYAPLGKIRHCIFFFLSRGLFGARLGRRGIIRSPLAIEGRR